MGAPLGNRNAAGSRGGVRKSSSSKRRLKASIAHMNAVFHRNSVSTSKPKKGIGSRGGNAVRTKMLKEQAKQRRKNITFFNKIHRT